MNADSKKRRGVGGLPFRFTWASECGECFDRFHLPHRGRDVKRRFWMGSSAHDVRVTAERCVMDRLCAGLAYGIGSSTVRK